MPESCLTCIRHVKKKYYKPKKPYGSCYSYKTNKSCHFVTNIHVFSRIILIFTHQISLEAAQAATELQQKSHCYRSVKRQNKGKKTQTTESQGCRMSRKTAPTPDNSWSYTHSPETCILSHTIAGSEVTPPGCTLTARWERRCSMPLPLLLAWLHWNLDSYHSLWMALTGKDWKIPHWFSF